MKITTIFLLSRLFLFAFFQALIALYFQSWPESEKYWMLSATFTNIVGIVLLKAQFKKEGLNYFHLFCFERKERKKDFLLFLGVVLISIPLVLAPSFVLSNVLWQNPAYYHQILFQTLPAWLLYGLLIAFPLTISLAELGTYFGFVMPRLKKIGVSSWLAVALPVFFLSIQHCTLPLVFDAKFILFRALMYLPFALMLGVVLYKRPSLFPYLAILHGLLDALAVTMYLQL